MTNVVKFPDAKARRKTKAKGITLCKNGFHQWSVNTSQKFDVKQGRLVTVQQCTRCGEIRRTLT